jgi:bifunctional UDP-N-acetylglucosamine pyrophosphorylase/glucosamine-1-phosphate N-acetyltransferase
MDLAKINSIIYQRNNEKLMENGVTIIDPSTTFIDSTVTIGQDSIISPFTVLQGNTQVGTKCRIHPHCYLKDAILEDEAVVAPFTHVNGPVWE